MFTSQEGGGGLTVEVGGMGMYGKLGILISLTAVKVISAPGSLGETGLYQDVSAKTIASEIRSYSPQYPLWTDGALKNRWVYLPPGTTINNVDNDNWIFPVGTKFWKEFSFPHQSGSGMKRVETRYLEKKIGGTWDFAAYIWNEEESQATLAPSIGKKNAYPTSYGTTHDIPSSASCVRCHSHGGDAIIGFDPLQLSVDRDALAPHAELTFAGHLNLAILSEENRLTHPPSSYAPKIAARSPVARAALGYLHANCGSCHNPMGSAAYTQLYFRHSSGAESEASAPSFLSAVNQLATGYVIPGEDESFRIKPGSPEKSAVYFRLQASGFDRMPPLGSKVNDTIAADLIADWIKHHTQ